ncbi:MBL fold metallo-hydrolase [Streptoalloteichus hindustanus]|uniref:Uncharacterized protein n=1 Tax=Streptoalloteichus hindustanus TaxID=2017 RepID=A0A1M5M9T0_STRHI|nr:hypothetical protein [Streptoalloteichus hindustanus]SHG74030.1 hypothetical protein SAMN05444320_11344 [Streptoalloteichus hindustanus]
MRESEERQRDAHNSMSGEVTGTSFQAHTIQGDVHFHGTPGPPAPKRPISKAAWIGAGAVLVTVAAVGLVAANWPSGAPATQTGAPGTSAQNPQPAPTTSVRSTPSTAQGDEVRWAGRINLTYVKLDPVPPEVLSNNTGASVWVHYERGRGTDQRDQKATLYGLGGGFFTTRPTIALWEGSAEPTRQQCQDLISTRGAETLEVTKESRFCVLTAQKRVAYLSDLSYDGAAAIYMATVRIWNTVSP